MKAFVQKEIGTDPRVEQFAEPQAREGLTVARVLAAGLNPVDLAMASGRFGPVPTPRVVGMEAVVEIAGGPAYAGATVPPFGSFAERTLVDPSSLVPLPEGLDPIHALGLGISGITGWSALEITAALKPGETVIVLGATGAVGQIAVQAAKLLGARRVVAAGRSAETLERLRSRGADAVVVLTGPEDGARLLEATQGGADVVIDPIFGPPLVAALGALRPRGRAVTVGMSSGLNAELSFMSIFGKALYGYSGGALPAEQKRAVFLRMARHLLAKELVVDTEVVPLDRAGDAWKAQAGAPHRKIVLQP